MEADGGGSRLLRLRRPLLGRIRAVGLHAESVRGQARRQDPHRMERADLLVRLHPGPVRNYPGAGVRLAVDSAGTARAVHTDEVRAWTAARGSFVRAPLPRRRHGGPGDQGQLAVAGRSLFPPGHGGDVFEPRRQQRRHQARSLTHGGPDDGALVSLHRRRQQAGRMGRRLHLYHPPDDAIRSDRRRHAWRRHHSVSDRPAGPPPHERRPLTPLPSSDRPDPYCRIAGPNVPTVPSWWTTSTNTFRPLFTFWMMKE